MKKRKFAEIVWLDAVLYDRVNEETENKTPSDLLYAITSYGYILKEDKKAIVLTHEDAGDEKSFLVIPKKWIKSKRIFGEITPPCCSNVTCGVAQRRRLLK